MISVTNITKSFGKVKALRGVDLHVPEKTVHALLGPNGAGKTTLVRIMTTLMKPDTGSVTIDGFDTVKDSSNLRTKIGLAGQYAAIDEDLTGYENLYLFGRLYHLDKKTAKNRAGQLLDEFGLSDAANRPSKTYSGGMRRRLDIAASLIVAPPVLFLDEPTTGLDPASRKQVWGIIEDLVKGGATVLLTTQYLEEADYLADTISVMDKGKIIAHGAPDELKSQSGGNVLEVSIADKKDIDATRKILGQITDQPVHLNEEHLHLCAPVEGDANALIAVVRELDSQKIAVNDIQLRRPTLDDVFLALTGEEAEHQISAAEKKSKK